MVTQKGQGLRFAPLIRVSGEEQARTGESLETQRKQIEQAVATMGGRIPKAIATRYSGQEHATAGWERKKLNSLLADSAKGLFDAVIVADISRWSRDNEQSKPGLKTLRKNGIRFFVLTTEHDLSDSTAQFVLGVFSEINAYVARDQLDKSTRNRLQRLRRGYPACGSTPFGRRFDRGTETWSVDPEEQRFAQSIAERYLAGEQVQAIADENQMSFATIWRIISEYSGPEFVVVYNKPEPDAESRKRRRHRGREVDSIIAENRHRAKRVHEGVQEIELEDRYIFIIKVPPLLDEKTRAAIHRRADANRKANGPRKNRYLLGGYVHCPDCGRSLTGQTQPNKTGPDYRYYRHTKARRIANRECERDGMFVDADVIEEAVLLHLFSTAGNASMIRAAIERANPDTVAQDSARTELALKQQELKKVDRSEDRLVDAVADGLLPKEKIAKKRDQLAQQRHAIEQRIAELHGVLENIPTPEVVRAAASELARSAKRRAIIRSAMDRDSLDGMTYEQKRDLMDLFFAGRGPNGEKLGVFVHADPENRYRQRKGRKWTYEIRGRFTVDDLTGELPLSKRDRDALLDSVDGGTAAANLKIIYDALTPSCEG